jgi:hypothetical protein
MAKVKEAGIGLTFCGEDIVYVMSVCSWVKNQDVRQDGNDGPGHVEIVEQARYLKSWRLLENNNRLSQGDGVIVFWRTKDDGLS